VIRRGFWLTIGAALGIAGYRRLERLARALRPRNLIVPSASRPSPPSGVAAFGRDVRAGMARYMESQTTRSGPTLVSQHARAIEGSGNDSDNDKDGR
jgi:hypothetical protein